MDNWQTVITFTQPHEAHMAKGVLESQGIETLIQDEFTAQVHNFYSNAIGGVKLKIKESNFENGVSVLKDGGYILEDNEELRETELVEKTAKTNISVCPFCLSENITKNKEANYLTIIVYFVLGAFFPIFKRHYICYDCNKLWKYKS